MVNAKRGGNGPKTAMAKGGMKEQTQLNLLQLQTLTKKDPPAYRAEFMQQWQHYKANLDIFRHQPSAANKDFAELVTFLAHVAHCYKTETASLGQELIDLLAEHCQVLDPGLRKSLVASLILMRNKDLLLPTTLLELFFKLFRCKDKHLRSAIKSHIVNDIKNMNMKGKNTKVNRALQNFMYTMITDTSEIAAQKSLEVMIELYHKRIWDDSKTVNVVAQAMLVDSVKMNVAAYKFFTGEEDSVGMDDSDDEDNGPDVKSIQHKLSIGKKTKSKRNKEKKMISAASKREKIREKGNEVHLAALHHLHDPQGLCEKLFKKLKASSNRFEVRIMMMNTISRLISAHALFMFNFYPFLQKYLQPHQADCTKLLAYVAQASHDLIPSEVLEPVIKTICYNFVTDRCSGEAMTAGLNTIREISARAPHVMTEELLRDLAQYKNHKDKNVNMAAKSLITTFRALNPELLHKKDRGRPVEADDGYVPATYGSTRTTDFVAGAELLVDATKAEGSEGEEDEGEWEAASDEEEDDDDGEWVDVKHDDEPGVKWANDVVGGDEDDAPTLSKEELHERAKEMSMNRILTPADYKKIELAKKERLLNGATGSKKRRLEQATTDDDGHAEVVGESTITHLHKKSRQSKDEKLESVLEGRADRDKYRSRKGSHRNKTVVNSSTNEEKKKGKAFMMMARSQKVRNKALRSVRDKQNMRKMASNKRHNGNAHKG